MHNTFSSESRARLADSGRQVLSLSCAKRGVFASESSVCKGTEVISATYYFPPRAKRARNLRGMLLSWPSCAPLFLEGPGVRERDKGSVRFRVHRASRGQSAREISLVEKRNAESARNARRESDRRHRGRVEVNLEARDTVADPRLCSHLGGHLALLVRSWGSDDSRTITPDDPRRGFRGSPRNLASSSRTSKMPPEAAVSENC